MTFIHSLDFTVTVLTLKAPRKKMHLKMSSNFTDDFSIEANSVDPEKTALIRAV